MVRRIQRAEEDILLNLIDIAERQEPGSMLCAQHALNALLQGTYFDPSQLADIAKQLDTLEQTQLDEETWRNRDTASLNMDDTGG